MKISQVFKFKISITLLISQNVVANSGLRPLFAVAKLTNIFEKGLISPGKFVISRINLVLDHKATNKALKLWAFISQVIERTYLADNHSKILLPTLQNYLLNSLSAYRDMTKQIYYVLS